MNFSDALPTFLITLREGFEAALVVGIVLACLKKANQTRLNGWVYGGVLAGILASGGVGILFQGLMRGVATSANLYAPVFKQLLEAGFGLVAISMLSWMLIWMTQQSKSLKSEVEGAITNVIQESSRAGWGVFILIFIAVLREGFETVVFVAAQFQQGLAPALGALAGILGAAGLGILLCRWGVRINLRLFFQVMGVFLLLIVAGLVISTLRHLDNAASLFTRLSPEGAQLCVFKDSCLLGPLVWDTSNVLPERQFPGVILKVLLGYRDHLYLAQIIGYIGFLGIVGGLYLQSLGFGKVSRQSSQPSA
ncbi:MAG: FTR1 family iron permease [Oscillatoriales cyanobacterium RM2_1_1]|nr:FTR1 family iron permease [Oscillatoriales cyanobacterium SM2_3_0]NJO45277.1 FTR1 family iron permease [Oscillatoriales cyanobacterium RM2_1_1]